jgi:hypothetical protein
MKRLFIAMLLLFFVALIAIHVPNKLDDDGWMAHKQATDMMFNGDWMVGEFRTCDALAFKVARPKVDQLQCISGEPKAADVSRHSFPITFWGKIKRNDVFMGPFPSGYHQKKWSWRCQRQTERAACWALN